MLVANKFILALYVPLLLLIAYRGSQVTLVRGLGHGGYVGLRRKHKVAARYPWKNGNTYINFRGGSTTYRFSSQTSSYRKLAQWDNFLSIAIKTLGALRGTCVKNFLKNLASRHVKPTKQPRAVSYCFQFLSGAFKMGNTPYILGSYLAYIWHSRRSMYLLMI